jgi:archaetidylinositol phosphate synthase
VRRGKINRRELERSVVTALTGRIVLWLAARRVSPNQITYASFLTAVAASALYAFSGDDIVFAAAGGAVYLLSALMDSLDGQLARHIGRTTRLGGYLDSVFDKSAEVSVCVGITISGVAGSLPPLLFCATSLLVSYARARGEGVGVDLSGVGPAERAERVVLLSAASLLTPLYREALIIGLYAGSALSALTVFRRILHAARVLADQASLRDS